MTYLVAELSIYFDLSRGKFRLVYYMYSRDFNKTDIEVCPLQMYTKEISQKKGNVYPKLECNFTNVLFSLLKKSKSCIVLLLGTSVQILQN